MSISSESVLVAPAPVAGAEKASQIV